MDRGASMEQKGNAETPTPHDANRTTRETRGLLEAARHQKEDLHAQLRKTTALLSTVTEERDGLKRQSATKVCGLAKEVETFKKVADETRGQLEAATHDKDLISPSTFYIHRRLHFVFFGQFRLRRRIFQDAAGSQITLTLPVSDQVEEDVGVRGICSMDGDDEQDGDDDDDTRSEGKDGLDMDNYTPRLRARKPKPHSVIWMFSGAYQRHESAVIEHSNILDVPVDSCNSLGKALDA
ncbi:unnamed protein product [Vitrella brassicaformis CCMP3155]|uniref:Uncharacterized protein n=1 Tax=Vitrella brassicaformis (strain CCMP3155) TaxID=1169540 RepID=A0A0G4G184_VITBC|nr:unnamed protein product [Vitrella brassicaformis CCMP3155]|eukprot:CEM21753.1 unnamed protein product [Vitrella brassicaformis CCMP3155]